MSGWTFPLLRYSLNTISSHFIDPKISFYRHRTHFREMHGCQNVQKCELYRLYRHLTTPKLDTCGIIWTIFDPSWRTTLMVSAMFQPPPSGGHSKRDRQSGTVHNDRAEDPGIECWHGTHWSCQRKGFWGLNKCILSICLVAFQKYSDCISKRLGS